MNFLQKIGLRYRIRRYFRRYPCTQWQPMVNAQFARACFVAYHKCGLLWLTDKHWETAKVIESNVLLN